MGAFTSLDDLVGSAQDPGSLNRFLYAAANPATLVDPDGHCATAICNIDGDGASGADAAIAYTRLANTSARAASRPLPRARDFSRSGSRRERSWSGGSDGDYARKVRATSIAKQAAARSALTYAGLAGMATTTYERRVEIVRHEATAQEVLAMPVAVLGGGLVAAAGAPAAIHAAAVGWGVVGSVLGPVAMAGARIGTAGYIVGQVVTNVATGRDPLEGMSIPDIVIAAGAGAIMPGIGVLRTAPLSLATRILAGTSVGVVSGAASDAFSRKDTPTPVTGGLGGFGAAVDALEVPGRWGSGLVGFGVSVFSTFVQNRVLGGSPR